MELWWWILPMARTGFLTVFVGGTIAYLVHAYDEYSKIPDVLFFLSIIPWALAVCGAAVWVILNILILIWR